MDFYERRKKGIYCSKPLDEEECCFRVCKWDKVDRFLCLRGVQRERDKKRNTVNIIFGGLNSFFFFRFLSFRTFTNEFLVLKLAVEASRVRLTVEESIRCGLIKGISIDPLLFNIIDVFYPFNDPPPISIVDLSTFYMDVEYQ